MPVRKSLENKLSLNLEVTEKVAFHTNISSMVKKTTKFVCKFLLQVIRENNVCDIIYCFAETMFSNF